MASADKERGKRLRALRERAGCSQEEVARKLGVTSKTVWNWEAGSGIQSRHLRAVAELYGRPVEDLQGSVEIPSPFALREYINESLQEFRDDFKQVEASMRRQDRERNEIAANLVRLLEQQTALLEALVMTLPADPETRELLEALRGEAPPAEPAPSEHEEGEPGRRLGGADG